MAGGAFGAASRYGINLWMTRFQSMIPLGTLTVNVLGSLLIGLLTPVMMGSNANLWFKLALFTGFLGAFTTFSTYSLDTVLLFQSGKWQVAIWTILLHNGLSIAALAIGMILGQRV